MIIDWKLVVDDQTALCISNNHIAIMRNMMEYDNVVIVIVIDLDVNSMAFALGCFSVTSMICTVWVR